MEIKLNEQFKEIAREGATQWFEVKINVQSDKLNEIEQVEYFFEDPSVATPVIVSGSSYNNFEVQAKSWKDEFPVTAKVTFKNHQLSPVLLKGNEKQFFK